MGLSRSGINKENHIVNGSWIALLIDDSIGAILSVPFCPLPFCPRTLCAQYCQCVTENNTIRCVSSSLSDNLTLDIYGLCRISCKRMSDWKKAIFFTLCVKGIDRWTP